MKRILMFASVCALALGLSTTTALARQIAPSLYLGLINPSMPANVVAEAGYINTLLDVPLGSNALPIDGRKYTRSQNTCVGCPDATGVDALTKERDKLNPVIHTGIDVTGWTYLLAKYDGPNYGSAVWYVDGTTGLVDIPEFLPYPNKYRISHYTLFNQHSVPDGGMTLMLLGGALVGLEFLRRRLRA